MVEGSCPRTALPREGDGRIVFLALARRLTEQAGGQEQSLKALLAQTRVIKVEAEAYLGDGEWEISTRPIALMPEQPLPEVNMADLWQGLSIARY